MNSSARPFSSLPAGFSDENVDIQRYGAALRRNAGLIAAVVVLVTLAVVLITRATPKSYEASATIVFNPTATLLQPTDAASIQRQLATFQSLVDSPAVINPAARVLSESRTTLKNSISSSADPDANIITISASAPSAKLAAQRSNTTASEFLAAQKQIQTAGFQQSQAQLQAQINGLRATPGAGAEISALKDRISALQISSAGTTSQLQVGDPAQVPSSAASPKPALDGAIAFAVSLLLSVLFVLGRDQLRPRIGSPRELGRLLDLPVMAGIPYRRQLVSRKRRRALGSIEHEAYNALQTAIRVGEVSGNSPRLLLVTSATHGEGKTTVTANLGRSLARAGHKVLMISGDLRSPTLHQHFKLTPAAGFAECLRLAASDPKQLNSTLSKYVRSVPGELHLDLFDAGAVTPDPGLLLSGNALNALLTKLRRLHYKYILVDSAPILGLGDTQFMARHVDDILLVARLDAIGPDSAADLTDLLGRLDLHPLGVAVVGAKIELSPYYLNGPAPRGVDEAGSRVATEPESVEERRARIAANRAQQSQAG